MRPNLPMTSGTVRPAVRRGAHRSPDGVRVRDGSSGAATMAPAGVFWARSGTPDIPPDRARVSDTGCDDSVSDTQLGIAGPATDTR
eukprot:33252-Prymnesium_polylepis.1